MKYLFLPLVAGRESRIEKQVCPRNSYLLYLYVQQLTYRYSDMGRMSIVTRKRVVILWRSGYSLRDIQRRLREEETEVTLRSLQRLRHKFQRFHTVNDLAKRRKPRLLTKEMMNTIEQSLKSDDELTARKLKAKLAEEFHSLPNVSLATIKRCRKELGWVCTRPHYCQLIREANKEKRKKWYKIQLDNNEQFQNVVFTDECTVQLDHHGRLCFRKQKQSRSLKQRPKHPAKVHIWGGISMRGATRLVMFTGIMNAIKYGQILETGLVPFLRTCFPDGARLQQDNDPKHSSKYINRLFKFHNVYWWRTPPESPDLNPIENCWGSLKQYLRTSYKPTNLEELMDGIERFWLSLTPAICRKYIEHLHKVMPKVIEVNGNPSGY